MLQPCGGSWPWKPRCCSSSKGIDHGAEYGDQSFEVTDGNTVRVDPGEAAESGDHVADTGGPAIEADCLGSWPVSGPSFVRSLACADAIMKTIRSVPNTWVATVHRTPACPFKTSRAPRRAHLTVLLVVR
jgi:hypothetical protein